MYNWEIWSRNVADGSEVLVEEWDTERRESDASLVSRAGRHASGSYVAIVKVAFGRHVIVPQPYIQVGRRRSLMQSLTPDFEQIG